MQPSADRSDIEGSLDRGGSATAFQQEHSPHHSRESRYSAILRQLHESTRFEINVGHTCVDHRIRWTCSTTREPGHRYAQRPEVDRVLRSDSADSKQGTLVSKHSLSISRDNVAWLIS